MIIKTVETIMILLDASPGNLARPPLPRSREREGQRGTMRCDLDVLYSSHLTRPRVCDDCAIICYNILEYVSDI